MLLVGSNGPTGICCLARLQQFEEQSLWGAIQLPEGTRVDGNTSGSAAQGADLTAVAVVNQELADLSRAGLPLEAELARLAKSLGGEPGKLAAQLAGRLEAGQSLPQAMAAAGMPAPYCAVVGAGVASGRVAESLDAVVAAASREQNARNMAGIGLFYPLLTAVLACLVVTLLVWSVLPTLTWVAGSHARVGGLGTAPKWLLVTLGIVLPVLAMLAYLVWWWRSARIRGASNSWLAWIPGYAALRHADQSARLAGLLELLVASRVPLDESLRLTGEALPSGPVRRETLALADQVARGADLQSLDRNSIRHLPQMVQQAMVRTGSVEDLRRWLQLARDAYHDQAARRSGWLESMLPLVLLVSIGGTAVLAATLVLMWPYAIALQNIADAMWK